MQFLAPWVLLWDEWLGSVARLGCARPQAPRLTQACSRTLEEGQVITVEPGCYFNSSLLLPAFENPQQRQFLSKDALMGFMVRALLCISGAARCSVHCGWSGSRHQLLRAGGRLSCSLFTPRLLHLPL